MPDDGRPQAPATGTTTGNTTSREPAPRRAPAASQPPAKPAAPSQRTAPTTPAWAEADDWQALAEETRLTPQEVRDQLDRARDSHTRGDARPPANPAATAGTAESASGPGELASLREQLQTLQQGLAARDNRDVDRAGKAALTEVRVHLAETGVRIDDVQELLGELDPARLLRDGEPDPRAIARVVTALRKAAGRPAPDPDQGQTGGTPPLDMNTLIRRMAGRDH